MPLITTDLDECPGITFVELEHGRTGTEPNLILETMYRIYNNPKYVGTEDGYFQYPFQLRIGVAWKDDGVMMIAFGYTFPLPYCSEWTEKNCLRDGMEAVGWSLREVAGHLETYVEHGLFREVPDVSYGYLIPCVGTLPMDRAGFEAACTRYIRFREDELFDGKKSSPASC